MKYTILATIIMFVMISCKQEKSNTVNEISTNRIKLKEEIDITSHRYTIIEVDSVEYLTQDKGGFIRISK
jgi:hypothetical protein